MLFSLILDPVALCVILWLVARHTADYEFTTVLYVSLALTVLGAFLSFTAARSAGPLVALAVLFVVGMGLLVRFCYVNITNALISMCLFLAYKVGIFLAFQSMLHS